MPNNLKISDIPRAQSLSGTDKVIMAGGTPLATEGATLDDLLAFFSLNGYFKGIANEETNPGNPTLQNFYIAAPGTYTNFKDASNTPITVNTTASGLIVLFAILTVNSTVSSKFEITADIIAAINTAVSGKANQSEVDEISTITNLMLGGTVTIDQNLTIVGTGISKTNNDYTGTIIDGNFSNIGLGDKVISPGDTCLLQLHYLSAVTNSACVLGLKATNTTEKYTSGNYKICFYFYSGVVNVIDNGANIDTGIGAIVGNYYRIKASGTGSSRVYILQTSADGASYSTIYTFIYNADVSLYVISNILDSGQINNVSFLKTNASAKSNQSDFLDLQNNALTYNSLEGLFGTDAELTSSNPIVPKGAVAIVDNQDGFFYLKAGDGSHYTNLAFNVLAGVPVRTVIGVLYNKSTWANLDDFVIKGGLTASVVGSKIQISGGVGTLKKMLAINRHSNLPYWKITTVLKVLSIGASDYGFGSGAYATNPFNVGEETVIGLGRLETENGVGRASVDYGNTTGYGEENTNTNTLTTAVNDMVTLITERDGMALKVTATNGSQSLTKTHTYAFGWGAPPLPTSGLLGVFGMGGLAEIQSLEVASKAPINIDLGFVGDSKTQLPMVSSLPLFWVSVVSSHYPSKISLNFGAGYDRTQDVLLRMPEILMTVKAGTVIVLNIGSNDKRTGVTYATWWANYQNIVSQFMAAGCIVKHFLQLAEASLTFADYNTAITTTYSSGNIINVVLDPSTDLAPDGVHPYDLGQAKMAAGVIAALGAF